MIELSATITRQYIDAVAVFEALEEAQLEAAQVRGGMYWHLGPAAAPDAKYLVRTTPTGAETSLGPLSPENMLFTSALPSASAPALSAWRG